ncbi:MAG: hypothetical protein AMXMBFR13_15230 [Phycisphaerae bacterium]
MDPREITFSEQIMADQGDDAPKIFVDSDWKEQARREKEELDRETREMPRQGLPEPQLAELVQMVVLQASIGLGGFQDPQTGQPIPPNLPLAKHYIDLLELLQKKTQGRLDQTEQQIIEGTLYELRMAFVQVAGIRPGEGGAPEEEPGNEPT